jgi:hypothetical protein
MLNNVNFLSGLHLKFGYTTNCADKFCTPLSNGLCNKYLAFGNWQLA